MKTFLVKIFTGKYSVLVHFGFIFALGLIIFRNWLFTSQWAGGGDALGWIVPTYVWKDFRWLYVWRNISFGYVEGVAMDLKNLLLIGIYSAVADAPTTVKIFMFGSFLGAAMSMYVFAYRYTRHHTGALAASLIYVLNPWLFSQFTEAHADIIFSYAFAPLVFLMLDNMLKRRKLKDIVAFALGLWVVLTAFHAEFTVIYGVFLALFALFYVLFPSGHKLLVRLKHSLKSFLPACLMTLFLSAFFLIPFAFNTISPYLTSNYGYPLEWAKTTSYSNMTDAFLLKANEQWGYTSIVNLYTGIGLPDFPVDLFMLCLLLITYCLVLIFIRRDRYTTFFAVSALISVFIAKGSNPPFGYIFTWAWFNLPYFSVLRAASRWNAMTAFSNAFFVAVLVSYLVKYLQEKHAREDERPLHITLKSSDGEVPREFYVFSSSIDKLLSGVRKTLKTLSIILIICVFMTGFVANFYFFNSGLQVYTPPSAYLQPFEWIKTQPGDYKVVTLGSLGLVSPDMQTALGKGHDIGYDSYFIDDKPTLQNGGFGSGARTFLGHLQYYVVPQCLTDRVSDMLGAFNYRYTVIPSYADNAARNFFLNQRGVNVVFNQSSLVLENDYTPALFATNKHVVVVGGLESLESLLAINSFRLNGTALIFADQICGNTTEFKSILNTSEALIMVDSDPTDLLMMFLRNGATWINAADYGVRSTNSTKYWISSSDWKEKGKLVFGGDTLRTSGRNTIDMPFLAQTDGSYELWIRTGFGPSQGTLSVSVDTQSLEEVEGYRRSESMRWLNTTINLTKGSHTVSLESKGEGLCDVDAIAIIESSKVNFETENMIDTIQNFSGRLIYFLQAEDSFSYRLPEEWSTMLDPYKGTALYTDGLATNIAPEGNASASSVHDFNAGYAIDGNLTTRWASEGGMPQWLEVDWKNSITLTGIQVFFERAVAEDYAIQIWNGTLWINEINVTGNNQTENAAMFRQPVQTDKLRIYVTKAPAFDMVSIWELRCYSHERMSHPTANLYIPTSEHYMIGARFESSSEQGYLRVSASNYSAIFASPANAGMGWQEMGPYDLSQGNCSISIEALGKTELDAVVLVSLTDNESKLSLNDVFQNNDTPFVNHSVINPCTYNVHVNSAEPFFLVFSESYDPLWKIHIGDLDTIHVPVYSFLNGFFINRTGKFDLTLSFEGQGYYNVGAAISIGTFITIVVLLAHQSEQFKSFLVESRKIAKKNARRLLKRTRR